MNSSRYGGFRTADGQKGVTEPPMSPKSNQSFHVNIENRQARPKIVKNSQDLGNMFFIQQANSMRNNSRKNGTGLRIKKDSLKPLPSSFNDNLSNRGLTTATTNQGDYSVNHHTPIHQDKYLNVSQLLSQKSRNADKKDSFNFTFFNEKSQTEQRPDNNIIYKTNDKSETNIKDNSQERNLYSLHLDENDSIESKSGRDKSMEFLPSRASNNSVHKPFYRSKKPHSPKVLLPQCFLE